MGSNSIGPQQHRDSRIFLKSTCPISQFIFAFTLWKRMIQIQALEEITQYGAAWSW